MEPSCSNLIGNHTPSKESGESLVAQRQIGRRKSKEERVPIPREKRPKSGIYEAVVEARINRESQKLPSKSDGGRGVDSS